MGVVWLSVAMGDTRRALHTALCLRDMRLFTEEQKWGICVCGADLCEEVYVVMMVVCNNITRFLRTVNVSHVNHTHTLTHTLAHSLTHSHTHTHRSAAELSRRLAAVTGAHG